MRHARFGSFVGGVLGLSVSVVLVFGLLRWLNMPSGQLLDWGVGLAIFWWLLVVVTIPWNIHFDARKVLAEAAESRARGIAIDEAHVTYARRWVRWSLLGAIILHIASAAALYWLARAGISAIGYLGAAAALLLTGLRPAIEGYRYVSDRLRAIGDQVRHPREDVVTLRADLSAVLTRLDAIERALNPDEIGSFAAKQNAAWSDLQLQYDRLRFAHDELQATNTAEHARLTREAQQAVARITADGQVLDHVRELIRFFKEA